MDDLASYKADMFKALGHPIRLKIVELLFKGEASVTEIAESVGTGQSNASRHLALLRRAGIVGDRKDGLNVYYRVEMPCVANFFVCVTQAVKERLKANRSLLQKLR